MDIQQHFFEVPKTAKYAQIGNISDSTEEIWIVLHGYGQLAQYFIKNFEGIANENRVIIAPEGISRFYVKGFYGRVGASWMTKENRLQDIEDYINYLDILLDNLKTNYSKVVVFGFSQGGATSSRWLEKTKHNVDRLILWSSVFPNDIDTSSLASLIKKYECSLHYGDKDEFFTSEHFNQIKELESTGISIKKFEGKHEIPSEELQKII